MDFQLFERFRLHGDREALALLFQRYAGPIYAFTLSIVRDPSCAEDVTQEVFAKLLETSSAPETDRFRAWIYRIAANEALQSLRREKRRQEHHVQAAAAQVADGSMDEEAIRRELLERMHEEIGSLSADLQQPLLLRYQHGLSFEEIAQVLERPLGTVSWQVSEARDQLRRRIAFSALTPLSLESVMEHLPMPVPSRRLSTSLNSILKRAVPKPTGSPLRPMFIKKVASAAAVVVPLSLVILFVATFAAKRRDIPPSVANKTGRSGEKKDSSMVSPSPVNNRMPVPTGPAVKPNTQEVTVRLSILYPSGESVALNHTIVCFKRLLNLASLERREEWEKVGVTPSTLRHHGLGYEEEALGPFTATLPCTERTLFKVMAQIVFSAPRGACAYVVAGPGDTVDLKLEVDKHLDFETTSDGPGPDELLLQELPKQDIFGAIRGKVIGLPKKGYSLEVDHEPLRWFESEDFLLIPVKPGRHELRFQDDCCSKKMTAEVRGGEVTDLQSLIHTAQPTVSIGGTILDAEGRPLGCRRICVYEGAAIPRRSFAAETNSDGRFLIEGLDVAFRDPRILVYREGGQSLVDVPVILGATNQIIQLPRPRLRLKFVAETDRSPVLAWAEVTHVRRMTEIEPWREGKIGPSREVDLYLDAEKYPPGTDIKVRLFSERYETFISDWITLSDGGEVEIVLRERSK